YGNLGGSFAGSGGRLFGRSILVWFLGGGPFAVGLAAVLATIDWVALADGVGNADTAILRSALGLKKPPNPAGGLLIAGVTWAVFAGIVLYPAYQAIVMRWWLGGLRLGGAAVASDLRMRRYYGAYLRYLLYVMLFTIALSVVAGILAGLGYAALGSSIDFGTLSPDGFAAGPGMTIAAISLLVAYVIYFLGGSTI